MQPNILTKKRIAGLLGATALTMGGVDASVMNETPIQRVEMVANERVEALQIGNVVETTLPWKGEAGLKVKYDMGVPSIRERFADKRNQEVITEKVEYDDGGFKVDILLNEKPDTNVFTYKIQGWENYDFFYQPALTKSEIENGEIRDTSIVGSYAVYHKKLKNNKYKTGKVMHIPRPQVWELNNKASTTIWADLYIGDGELTVTVPQDYLDNATYPVRVDPTFGYTTAGASAEPFGYFSSVFGMFENSVVGTLDSVTASLNASAFSNISIALNVSDNPAKNAQKNIMTGSVSVSPSVQSWYTATASGQALNGTVYVTAETTSAWGKIFYDTASATKGGGYANSFTGSGWFANTTKNYSIYATYTGGGGGGGGGGGTTQTDKQSIIWFN